MTDSAALTDHPHLVGSIDQVLARLQKERRSAAEAIASLDAEQAALTPHPNYTAHVHGGMLHARGFGAAHVLAVLGFHLLAWREALLRLEAALTDNGELFAALLRACAADPALEEAGHRCLAALDLLKNGAIDPFWIKRPALGLGQAAKMMGLDPAHADGHRGLYALPIAVLARGLAAVAAEHEDQRFGALLLPVVIAGGERLARIGAAAFHRDAEARYREDCRRFAAHQRASPDRRWRWKPPLARQGHLAVTTARAQGIAAPAERTRGHAANWLDDHDANIRFNAGEVR